MTKNIHEQYKFNWKSEKFAEKRTADQIEKYFEEQERKAREAHKNNFLEYRRLLAERAVVEERDREYREELKKRID